MHAEHIASNTIRWNAKTGTTFYWSTDLTLAVKGADDRPIAGATITAAWTGAVSKTASCVTSAAIFIGRSAGRPDQAHA